MTDINVDELIAEARRAVKALGVRQSAMLVNRLADALEAVKRERDEALAVIERIGAMAENDDAAAWDSHQELIRLVARSAAADALRERDAEKWYEGYHVGVQDVVSERLFGLSATGNPYRTEAERG